MNSGGCVSGFMEQQKSVDGHSHSSRATAKAFYGWKQLVITSIKDRLRHHPLGIWCRFHRSDQGRVEECH
jgi:hypothetical protein